MKSPAVVLIPSLLGNGPETTPGHAVLEPDFEPIHPLAQRLRHVLSAPETSTIGDMAELIDQLMGELKIMGTDMGSLPPPPQPMPPLVPQFAALDGTDGALTDDQKLELGHLLLAMQGKTAESRTRPA